MPSIQSHIAGVDEVGRGSLFGPVFASAVILDKLSSAQLTKSGLKDSKLISAKKRGSLIPLIKDKSLEWSLGQASSHEIDNIGIRYATELAMLRALQKLYLYPSLVLIDGNLPLRVWKGAQRSLIHGESKSVEIAAASVIAKEARDELIRRLAKLFPGYDLERNVGYGTKSHRIQILNRGPSILHRKSFLSRII